VWGVSSQNAPAPPRHEAAKGEAEGGQMTSESNPAHENNSENDSNRNAAQDSGESNAPLSPTMAAPPPNPPTPPSYQITCNHKRDWMDRVEFGMGVVGLVVLIGYSTFAALQWCAMNRTYREIHNQTPSIIEAAKDATQANKDAADRFRLDQRPYIWLDNLNNFDQPVFVPYPQGNTQGTGYIYWNWKIKNFGRSPTSNVMARDAIEIGENAINREPRYNVLGPAPPMAPTYSYFATAYVHLPQNKPQLITGAQFLSLMSADNGIVMHGQVVYKDIYDVQYEMGFCAIHYKNGMIGLCRKGNYIK
jgi:hypothetical protein